MAALAADPDVARKAGGLFGSWELAEQYGFTYLDGARPHWMRYFTEHVGESPIGPPRTAYRWQLTRTDGEYLQTSRATLSDDVAHPATQ